MPRSDPSAHRPAASATRSVAILARTFTALLALSWSASSAAAGIYVIDSRIERDGASALAPTFIATEGERALIAYQGERDLEVAMTVLPGANAAADDALEVRIELIEGMEVSDARLDVTLGRPGTTTIGEREITVLVREQAPAPDTQDATVPASAPASEDVGNEASDTNAEQADTSSDETDEAATTGN